VTCEVPVFYATTEGQTRRIAERIAARLRDRGFDSDALELAASAPMAEPTWRTVRGVVLGASLHIGKHQKPAAAFAAKYREHLNARPSAFFSVSMSAASANAAERDAAMALARAFVKQAGWQPDAVVSVAGRLAYPQYRWFTRLLMRWIAKREGGPTDTTRDHELTDWQQVDRLADDMADRLVAGRAKG
jgi:menaquinone-dependent protoporphyrinogen oxidase